MKYLNPFYLLGYLIVLTREWFYQGQDAAMRKIHGVFTK